MPMTRRTFVRGGVAAFTMGFAHFYLGEKTARSEVAGLLLVAIGVVLALAGAW